MADGVDIEVRTPLNGLTQLLLPEVALPVLMALQLPRSVKVAVSITLLGSILHTFMTSTTGHIVNDYAIASAVLGNTFFNVILFLCILDPMSDFHYTRDPYPRPLATRSLLSRLYNSLCIVRNYRLIGWNVQTPNVPPQFTGPRLQFLLRQLGQLLSSAILTDLAESFIYPYFHLYVPGPSDPRLTAGVTGYLFRSWCLFVWLLMTYAILKMYYVLASILAVALRLGEPQDWPDMFGNWSDAYTLRRLWGRTWHQNLRRHFSHWGKLAVRVLRIPRGTWLSSQTQLHVAFLVSAVLHSFGDLMLGKRHFGRSFPFFVANALAITFEDAVLALGKSLLGLGGPTRATKAVGYVWVALWIRCAAPTYVDWMFESGVTATRVLPFSPTTEFVLPWMCVWFLFSSEGLGW
ncbi:membrane bound O-acyl transferase family-domain-containing protein [Daedaleopsis nitida]|nr:membrane bound O-acyl transferase family-domain-containing protein [Daedaleopsis nitida]